MWRIKSKVLIKKGQELLRKADNKWVNNVEREEIRIRPSREKERKVKDVGAKDEERGTATIR